MLRPLDGVVGGAWLWGASRRVAMEVRSDGAGFAGLGAASVGAASVGGASVGGVSVGSVSVGSVSNRVDVADPETRVCVIVVPSTSIAN